MGRLRGLAAILAGALAAGPAGAAEITRVHSSGEPDNPFDLSATLTWERLQRSSKITREFGNNADLPTGIVEDAEELRFKQVSNRIIARVAVGLWHDLEFRVEIPYVLNDDSSTRYSTVGGVPVDQAGVSGIAENTLTPDGTLCAGAPATPCPMFPVGQTLYAGGKLDDIRFGIAWGIFAERKDEWMPTWVLSLDVRAPTATGFDPAEGRTGSAAAYFGSPHFSSSNRANVGRRIWTYEIATALSKRLGVVDPYFRLRARIPQVTGQTYSNCDRAAELTAIGQMTTVAPANCTLDAWKTQARADPPQVWGADFGVEFIPYEDRASAQKLSIDVRLGADFVTRSRWYNELTPATGKLLQTEPYVTASAMLGLYLRASRYVSLGLTGTFAHDWDHFVTGEGMGKNATEQVPPNSPQQNPNFDFRYDLPGRRFRVADSTVFGIGAIGQVTF